MALKRCRYDVVKLLLMRGITIPVPHKHTCGCAECMLEVERDALRRSQVRFNQMRLNEMICSTCGQAAQSRKGCIKAFTGKIESDAAAGKFG